MGTHKIELNEIEWITNGERASALNLNRALKQFLTKNNAILDDLDTRLSEVTPEEGQETATLLKKINHSNDNITAELLGQYAVRSRSISVQTGLPQGWNCHITTESNDIIISLGSDTIIETGANNFTIPAGRTAELVKVTNSKWVVNINRLLLKVEDIEPE